MPSRDPAPPYALAAVLMFAFESVAATLAGLALIFPDLPLPVSWGAGRAIHLNMSLIWPFMAMIGGSYYLLERETGGPLHSRPLAWAGFWFKLAITTAILGALAFGWTAGREYLEAPPSLLLVLVAGLALFGYNVVRTVFRHPGGWRRPVPLGIALGALTLVPPFIPNLFFWARPSLDDVTRLTGAHLLEEWGLGLISATLLVGILVSLAGEAGRAAIERWLYVQLGIIAVGALLSTGHHLYWVGAPRYWALLGIAGSAMEVIPMLLMLAVVRRARAAGVGAPGQETVFTLIRWSVLYRLIGAGALGLAIGLRQTNLYAHGTYLASAHAHLAVAGASGFLALGISYRVLQGDAPPPVARGSVVWALWLLNAGLLAMGLALLGAGVQQVLLWRVRGGDFMEVQMGLRPWMVARGAGGAIFAAGAVLFAWSALSAYRLARDTARAARATGAASQAR